MTNPFMLYLEKKKRYYFTVFILSIVIILPITLYLNIRYFLYLNFIVMGITSIFWCLGEYEDNEINE